MTRLLWEVEDLYPKLLYLKNGEYSFEDLGKFITMLIGEVPYKKTVSYFKKRGVSGDSLRNIEGEFQRRLREKIGELCNIEATIQSLKNEGFDLQTDSWYRSIANNPLYLSTISQLIEAGFRELWEKNDFSLKEGIRRILETNRFFSILAEFKKAEEENKFVSGTLEDYVAKLINKEKYEDLGTTFIKGARLFYNNPERQKNIVIRAYKRFLEYNTIQKYLIESLNKNKQQE